MKTRMLLLVVAGCLLLPAAVSAQQKAKGPEMSRWWERPVVRDIGLSAEQDRQVRAIVRESRDRLIQLRGAVDSAESALSDEMNEERVDPKKAEAIIERVVTTRGELMRAIAQMSLRLRVILTTAQWRELEKREAENPNPPPQNQPRRKEDPQENSRPPRPEQDKDEAES
jgi:Spy/CpxP family protein refolding chaperone